MDFEIIFSDNDQTIQNWLFRTNLEGITQILAQERDVEKNAKFLKEGGRSDACPQDKTCSDGACPQSKTGFGRHQTRTSAVSPDWACPQHVNAVGGLYNGKPLIHHALEAFISIDNIKFIHQNSESSQNYGMKYLVNFDKLSYGKWKYGEYEKLLIWFLKEDIKAGRAFAEQTKLLKILLDNPSRDNIDLIEALLQEEVEYKCDNVNEKQRNFLRWLIGIKTDYYKDNRATQYPYTVKALLKNNITVPGAVHKLIYSTNRVDLMYSVNFIKCLNENQLDEVLSILWEQITKSSASDKHQGISDAVLMQTCWGVTTTSPYQGLGMDPSAMEMTTALNKTGFFSTVCKEHKEILAHVLQKGCTKVNSESVLVNVLERYGDLNMMKFILENSTNKDGLYPTETYHKQKDTLLFEIIIAEKRPLSVRQNNTGFCEVPNVKRNEMIVTLLNAGMWGDIGGKLWKNFMKRVRKPYFAGSEPYDQKSRKEQAAEYKPSFTSWGKERKNPYQKQQYLKSRFPALYTLANWFKEFRGLILGSFSQLPMLVRKEIYDYMMPDTTKFEKLVKKETETREKERYNAFIQSQAIY